MNIDKKLAVTISGVACLLTIMRATPVSAAIFNFSYSGTSARDSTNTVTTSGVLTTEPYDPATNSYQITDITGTRNAEPIDSLLSPNSFLDNNNLLFADSPQLDEFGFAYTVGGQPYNVFHTYRDLEISYIGNNFIGYPLTSFSVTPVPEPSSMLGILGIGVLTGGTLLKRFYRSLYVKKSKITEVKN